MRKSHRVIAAGAACALAGVALYGAGVATAGQSTANSTHEPYNIGQLVKDIDTYYGTTADSNAVQAHSGSGFFGSLPCDLRLRVGSLSEINEFCQFVLFVGVNF